MLTSTHAASLDRTRPRPAGRLAGPVALLAPASQERGPHNLTGGRKAAAGTTGEIASPSVPCWIAWLCSLGNRRRAVAGRPSLSIPSPSRVREKAFRLAPQRTSSTNKEFILGPAERPGRENRSRYDRVCACPFYRNGASGILSKTGKPDLREPLCQRRGFTREQVREARLLWSRSQLLCLRTWGFSRTDRLA